MYRLPSSRSNNLIFNLKSHVPAFHALNTQGPHLISPLRSLFTHKASTSLTVTLYHYPQRLRTLTPSRPPCHSQHPRNLFNNLHQYHSLLQRNLPQHPLPSTTTPAPPVPPQVPPSATISHPSLRSTSPPGTLSHSRSTHTGPFPLQLQILRLFVQVSVGR